MNDSQSKKDDQRSNSPIANHPILCKYCK